MIKRLAVSNYRSLGDDVTVSLGRLTALVGPNGSGKSSFMDALRLLSDSMHVGLAGAITQRHQEIGPVRRWRPGHPHNTSIHAELDLEGGSASYYFEITGSEPYEYRVAVEEARVLQDGKEVRFRVENGQWITGPPGLQPALDDKNLVLSVIGGDARFQPLLSALQRIAIYVVSPDVLRAPQKYSPVRPMDRHGSNWASILRDQPEDTWKPELVSALYQLTGSIDDVRVKEAANYQVVQFHHLKRSRQWFDAAQESDGTLRIAGILTGLLQEPSPQLVGIEEPELTVHPGAIPLLYDFLQQTSRRAQVIVTTHSPELLDLIDAESVRVVVQTEGGTTITPISKHQRKAVRQGLMTIGEVLRTEGLQQDPPLAVAE